MRFSLFYMKDSVASLVLMKTKVMQEKLTKNVNHMYEMSAERFKIGINMKTGCN